MNNECIDDMEVCGNCGCEFDSTDFDYVDDVFDEDAPNPVIYICASVASGITANLFALIYGDISPINSLKQASMIL